MKSNFLKMTLNALLIRCLTRNLSVLASYYDCFDDENWTFDEGWEDEAEKFYNQNNNEINNLINNDDLPF